MTGLADRYEKKFINIEYSKTEAIKGKGEEKRNVPTRRVSKGSSDANGREQPRRRARARPWTMNDKLVYQTRASSESEKGDGS